MQTETFRGEGHATKIYQAPVVGQTQSQLPVGTTKKHMSDAKSTKSDSTASCLSAAPAMLSHGWKHWIRLDPRWRFEGIV